MKFSYPGVPVDELAIVPKTTFLIFSSDVEFPLDAQYESGGVVVVPVFTLKTLLAAEAFPAASLAFTVKL